MARAGGTLTIDVGKLAAEYNGYRSLLRFILYAFLVGPGGILATLGLFCAFAFFSDPSENMDAMLAALVVAVLLAFIGLPLWLLAHFISQYSARLSKLDRRSMGVLHVLFLFGICANVLALGYALVGEIPLTLLWLEYVAEGDMLSVGPVLFVAYLLVTLIVLLRVLWASVVVARLSDLERATMAENARGDEDRASLLRTTGLPPQITSKFAGFSPPFFLGNVARLVQFGSIISAGLFLLPMVFSGTIAATYYIWGADLRALSWAVLGVVGVSFVISVGAKWTAVAVFRASLRSTASIDDRFPVLFLRSFKDDQASFQSSILLEPLRQMTVGFEANNLDQLLVEEALGYGPVVALGKPGEGTPPLGARRAYVHHAGWQDMAADLMQRARAIIIVLDDTPGTRWEIEAILNSPFLYKTLFLAPPRGQQRAWLGEFAALESLVGDDHVIAHWSATPQRQWIFRAERSKSAVYRLVLRAFFRGLAEDPRLDVWSSPESVRSNRYAFEPA